MDTNRLEQIAGPGLLRSYNHDDGGNTSAEGRVEGVTLNWTYSYNPLNRLASVAVNGVHQADYRYNALGQQVHRDVGGTVTLSVHDLAGNRIAEHDGAGVVLREYIWLDGLPLAVVEGGQTFWLHWDHILRPVLATGATGAVVWAARYLPFGGIDQVSVDTGVLTQNLRFPGQWFQAETGLHQNWMRDYDPTTGRYLQADPLGLVDGASVYGYARMSPAVYSDPTGRSVSDLINGMRSYFAGLYNAGRFSCRAAGACGAAERRAAHREFAALLDLLNTLQNNPEALDCFLFSLDFYLNSQKEKTGARIATGGGVTALLTKKFKGYGAVAGIGLGGTALFGDIMRGIEKGLGYGALVRGITGELDIPPNLIPLLPCGCEEILRDVTDLG